MIERGVTVRGINLHLLEAGDGPLVVLLHGFPEFSYQWRRQIPALAAAGYRVAAPDQRGYGRSDKPKRRRDYDPRELAADVVALVDAYGAERAAVVGHDWGGLVAYYTAMLHGDRVEKLAIMNAPHPAHFERVIRRNPRQLRRSWYAMFFSLPVLPELMLSAGGWLPMRRVLQRHPRPGAFSADDIERYVESWSRPGAIKAMVDYYRASILRRPASIRALWKAIELPTLILWGDRDRHLVRELAEPPRDWVRNATVVRFPEASHWLPHDEPDRVNELLVEFLARSS